MSTARGQFKPNSHAWCTRQRVKPDGGREDVTTLVRVLCIAEGFAMVRHPGCMPFVESLNNIEFVRAAASLGERGKT